MIEGISHITFVVKNLDRTAKLYKELFEAKEIYNSGENTFSISKEKFFIIGNQWIAVMENDEIIERTYHHLAFKICEEDFDSYLNKIQTLNLEMKMPRPRVEGEGRSVYFYDFDNNLFELHTGTLENRLKTYEKKGQ